MRRFTALLGLITFVAAGSSACAQTSEITLFGRKYRVECQSRGQTFKTRDGREVKIQLSSLETSNQKATMYFVEGADPSQDRLFVAAAINQSEDDTGHQLYLLTGADANGNFTPASATLTEFFGGNVNFTRGGRPVAVIHLSDVNTGVKVDRNIALHTFAGTDFMRFYDLDTMTGSFEADAVLSIQEPQDGGDDPGFPWGDFGSMAPGPGGTIVKVGQGEDGVGIEIGVMDPRQDKFFNVKTNTAEVIPADSPIQIEEGAQPHGLIRISDTEYWLLASQNQGGNADSTEYNYLYRLQLTFPSDFAAAGPNSIRVAVLGRESLLGTPLAASDGGVFGIAVGRAVNGGRRIYFADWRGNLCVATPQP